MQQISIEEQAIQTFQENLRFFQMYNLQVYNKIVALNTAIEKGYYEEKYDLEYKDEGYFDVKEKTTGNYLYNSDSNIYAQQAANSIDYKKIDNLFETFHNVSFSKESIKKIEEQSDLTKYGYAPVVSLLNYSKEHASKDKTTMIKIYKFIFLGTGLGTHISTIHEKINSNVYLIIEDDLELFRLSLFVTNYQKLTENNNAKLFFSIFDDEVDFSTTVQNFLKEQFIYNHYLKFFKMLNHDETKLKEIQSIIVTQPHISFNYSALLISMFRPLEHLINKYKILKLNANYQNSPFSKYPVLLIGAGPSFDKNIDWLKQNHKKFIIVTVSALMAKFEEIGIKPDIITHTHGFKDAMPHIEKVKDMRFFDETILLFAAMSYPKFMEKFKKENVYIFEGSSSYKNNFGSLTAPNIGALSYGLLLLFKTNELYLLGLDFAMDQESGSTHSTVHAHTRKLKLELHDVGGGINARNEIIEVEGNFQKTVYTTPLLNSMKRQCNLISKSFKKRDQLIYNLSDGAKINDAIALKINDQKICKLEKINKTELYQSFHRLFDKNSENFLTRKEWEHINKRLTYYDSIIEILKKHLETPHYNDINQYHYNLLGTFYNILSDNTNTLAYDIDTLLTLYLEFMSGYLFDLINTREIKNKKKLIKQLDQITIPQLIRMINFYKEKIETYLQDIEIKEESTINN